MQAMCSSRASRLACSLPEYVCSSESRTAMSRCCSTSYTLGPQQPAQRHYFAQHRNTDYKSRGLQLLSKCSVVHQSSAAPSDLQPDVAIKDNEPRPSKIIVMPTPILPSTLVDAAAFQSGALLIDKPYDWTSFDVCGKLRNTLKFVGKLKVGHAGTLDPMATGLLIICTGKGTKAIDSFVAMEKTYSGTIRLGEGTETYDAETEVSERLPWEHITDDDIRRKISASFMGDLQQVPPMYSAIKVKGQRLYDLAREGQVIEREPRAVTVSRFDVHRDSQDPQSLHFIVDCSKGTYIRSLAYDLGRALGTAAHLTALRRDAIGKYELKDAWQLPHLLEQLALLKQQMSMPAPL